MIGFTLQNPDLIKLWLNDKDRYGFVNYPTWFCFDGDKYGKSKI